jgi:hypothetical protein
VQGQVAQAGVAGARMQSSARARRRYRSSSRAIGVCAVLVANTVSHIPSASVKRNCAPGCGRCLG